MFWPAAPGSTPAEPAQIVVFGEVHDNPKHHASQYIMLANDSSLSVLGGRAKTGSRTAAIVYEMLTPEQAALVTPELIKDEAALEAALGWHAAGWPDFGMYYPIFSVRPQAVTYGAAIPRDAARKAMRDGIVQAFGPEAARYGLTDTLHEYDQNHRNALQMTAHCDALPEELLPAMVEIQRLRDARLAQVTLQAFDETGGPVLVITGNGHARKDWGVPAILNRVRPDVSVFTILQGEDGIAPQGGGDLILDAPAPQRNDPCAAFNK